MINSTEKAKVSIGANPVHRFPKKFSHLTTSKFMEFNIATAFESPKAAVSMVHKTFMRSFALKRPLMSNINIKKQAFFVPFRTVWEPWSDFREDVPHNQPAGTGIISNNPLLDLGDLIDLFQTSTFSTYSNTVPSDLEHGFDFLGWNSVSNAESYYTFTSFGRWAYKLFTSLGLRIPFADGVGGALKGETVSCLPLLCVAKVYLDYFFPNQYAHYGVYATIDGIMQRQVTYTLTGNEIKTILEAIYLVAYSSDYFISAFDTPVISAQNVQSVDFKISDITNNASASRQVVTNDSSITFPSASGVKPTNGTPFVGAERTSSGSSVTGQYSNPSVFTQYVDSHLKALTNYITRHSLAGSRALTRYLADWGVTLTADKLKRCYKLNEISFPVQVGDVTATSDTYNSSSDEGAQLGDIAGRSVAFDGSFKFDADTDEDGMFIVTYSIIPDVSYVQGIQRYWFHKTKLDYLTGDFDGLSIREIRQIELFVGLKRVSNSWEGIFGYVPSYAEYKINYDIQDGDFAVPTKQLGLYGFESARLFSDVYGDTHFNVAHGLNFVLANDADQFGRIFYDDEDDADKFVLVHRAEFQHTMPAVPLYDMYDFEDGKKQITLAVNGQKDN